MRTCQAVTEFNWCFQFLFLMHCIKKKFCAITATLTLIQCNSYSWITCNKSEFVLELSPKICQLNPSIHDLWIHQARSLLFSLAPAFSVSRLNQCNARMMAREIQSPRYCFSCRRGCMPRRGWRYTWIYDELSLLNVCHVTWTWFAHLVTKIPFSGWGDLSH